MTKTIRLSDVQLILLSNAAARDNGSLIPLPASCAQDSAAIDKAIASLLRRKLVEEIVLTDRGLCWREQGEDLVGLFITDAGRSAIGVADASANDAQADSTGSSEANSSNANSNASKTNVVTSPCPGSKIGAVLGLLGRDEGATLDEMVAATGWLPHTTRAALTGLRKKGHMVTSEKVDGVRRYHVAVEPVS